MNYVFTPHTGKQALFMTHPARTVGYGGSAGSGKSTGLTFHHCYLLDFEDQRWRRGEIKQSSAWVIYFRRVYPNLKQSVAYSLRNFPLIDEGVKWNAADHIWTYPCGLHFQFGAMEKPSDFLKYYSHEHTEQLFDELTEFEEEQWDQLDTRLRTADPALSPFLNRRWGSNPVGSGLLWVRRRFVEPAPAGKTVRVRVKLADGRIIDQDQVFIQAYLSDNPALASDGKYEAALRRNKPHIFKALFEGDWYVSPGGLLSDFWNQDLHVCENHRIPPNVFRFRSCDFGTNAPSSITWWYVDHDGAMTAYYNLYVKGLTADRQAARIREIEKYFGDWDPEIDRSMLRRSPLDAQCFKSGGTSGPSIADEFRQHGVMWMPSIKDRFNGIAEVARRLNQFVPLSDGRKKPMIRWMKRCEAPIRLLPILPNDPNNAGDVPKGCEDHVLDDTMYACGSMPLKAPKLRVVDDDYEEEDEYRQRFNKRRMAQIG